MNRFSKRTAVATLGAALALTTVAACSSSKGGSSGSGPTTTKPGGTLYYTTGTRNVEHWDPQRMYIGRDLANATRLFYRTLTMLSGDNKLVPDLATDTGKASNGNKTWTFTLKTGPTWQDGSPVTCADLKYGVSRTFAQDIITGGPSYALQFLNIPATPNDQTFNTAYHGPYTKVGQSSSTRRWSATGRRSPST